MPRFTSRRPEKPERSKRGAYPLVTTPNLICDAARAVRRGQCPSGRLVSFDRCTDRISAKTG